MVLNLLKNSVEAFDETRSRSRSIEVRARKVNSEVVEVSVGDNGPGLTDTEKVFEAFYTTKSDALGIGLAICRSIVEAMAVSSVQATERGGALVAFTLPTNGRAGIGAAGSDVVDIATLERGELQ